MTDKISQKKMYLENCIMTSISDHFERSDCNTTNQFNFTLTEVKRKNEIEFNFKRPK